MNENKEDLLINDRIHIPTHASLGSCLTSVRLVETHDRTVSGNCRSIGPVIINHGNKLARWA